MSGDRVCQVRGPPFLPQEQQEDGEFGLLNFSLYDGLISAYFQCMGELLEGTYLRLGQLSSSDLLSFAYQIASGMVRDSKETLIGLLAC